MTLPCERTRAVQQTREFLYALLDPKQTPRIPRDIRQQARRLLRHYPWTGYIEESAEKMPDIWGKPE